MDFRLRAAVFFVLGALLLAGTADDSLAQGRRKPAQVKLPTVNFTGQVKAVRRDVLLVSNETQAYYVRWGPKTNVGITGDRDATILKAKMFVRFDVKMDGRGIAKEESAKLELFTYNSMTARTGIEKKGEGEYLVAGQIKSISKAGRIVVVAGKKTIKGQVAKNAPVNIGVSGAVWLRLAKPGDSVTVFGKVSRPSGKKSAGTLLADMIDIKLSKPLPAKTKPKKKSN